MPRKDDFTVDTSIDQEKYSNDSASHVDENSREVVVTMDDAFATLCHAMLGKVATEENLALEERIHMIMGFYENKLHVVAWRHAVQILEQVLGESLVDR